MDTQKRTVVVYDVEFKLVPGLLCQCRMLDSYSCRF